MELFRAKRTVVVLGLVLILAAVGYPAREEPVLLLYERNPWLMVIGSDSPTFAHYKSGLTIYWHKTGPRTGEYRSVYLEKENSNAEFAERIKGLVGLKRHYETSRCTDQPTNVIYYSHNGSMQGISVYGDPENPLCGESGEVPAAFVGMFKFLKGYDHPGAAKWTPSHVEVMVWPYEYAPDKSTEWPEDWPDTKSRATIKRGDSFSIFLPYEKFDQLKELIRNRAEKGAVKINGKKWAISYRMPFPHEMK